MQCPIRKSPTRAFLLGKNSLVKQEKRVYNINIVEEGKTLYFNKGNKNGTTFNHAAFR
jgi:hypothetical protein